MDKLSNREVSVGMYRELLKKQKKRSTDPLRLQKKNHVNKHQKTTTTRFHFRIVLVVVFCMLALPLLLSFFASGKAEYHGGSSVDESIRLKLEGTADSAYFVTCSRASGTLSVPMEEYLVYALTQTMGEQEPKEAMMAMAVLLRTQIVYETERMGGFYVDCVKTMEELTKEWAEKGEAFPEIYLSAVCDTGGIIMTYQGEPVETAYHQVSAGSTRNGAEVFGDRFPYLVSADCEVDLMSPDYRSVITYSKKEFFSYLRKLTGNEELTDAQVTIDTRDQAGYILSISISGETFDSICVGGETFRSIFLLPSSNFTMDEDDNNVIFTCKGKGHGFGMSIYKACRLAEDGSGFMDIIRYFYQDIVFMRIS